MFNFKFVKFLPSEYVIRYNKGKVVEEGVGLAFRYYEPNTSVVVVPISSSDASFMFQEITSDYQTVTIQGEITYRIADYKKIAELLDYSYDMRLKLYLSEDNKKLPQRLVNITKVLIKKYIENMGIKEAIKAIDVLANKLSDKLLDSEEIKSLGVEVMRFSILAISPTKETARALEAEAREQILNKADDAIYDRRNASIIQERTIKENELNTDVAIEEKKKQIQETQLESKRVMMQKENEIKSEEQDYELQSKKIMMQKENEMKAEERDYQIESKRLMMQKENELKAEELDYQIALEEKKKEFALIAAENEKAKADSKAYELEVMMKVFEKVSPNVLQALASMGMSPDKLMASSFRELANNAAKIGQLNISPDLLQGIMNGGK